MPLNNAELMHAAEMVAECEEMKVTIKYSMLGASITALTTMFGGLLAGPVGLAAGATLGGVTAYSVTRDKFKSVVQILKEDLTFNQKERLANHLQRALRDLDISDAMNLFMMISCREGPAILIITRAMIKFFEGDMSMNVMSK